MMMMMSILTKMMMLVDTDENDDDCVNDGYDENDKCTVHCHDSSIDFMLLNAIEAVMEW